MPMTYTLHITVIHAYHAFAKKEEELVYSVRESRYLHDKEDFNAVNGLLRTHTYVVVIR
jgi:hypothetical protein